MAKGTIQGSRLEAANARRASKHKPLSRVIQSERVDFDKGFECLISQADYQAKRTIKLAPAGEADKGFKAPRVRGWFARLEEDNGKVKVVRDYVKSAEGLQAWLADPLVKASRLKESDPFHGAQAFKSKALREDSFATGTDSLTGYPATDGPPNNEYVPIMGGPFSKQLYLFDYLSMHAKCFEAKNHNPLAKEIVDVITFFCIGKGVAVKWTSPQIQVAWDAFVKRNKFDQFVRMDSDTLTWAGEMMTHWDKNNGLPLIRHIDPSTVWEIVTDILNIDIPYYFHQQFPTQYQLTYKPGDVGSEYVVNDIPAAEVIHVKINTVPGEKRGRSDLFNILGWLKTFKDYYAARVTKAQIEESFAIDVTVKGSPADVLAYIDDPQNRAVPRSGDKWVHNEAVEPKFLSSTASSTGNSTDSIGEGIRSICATGAGLSPEYLGVSGKSSARANSITKAEPSARKFEDRQTIFKWYIGEICERFLADTTGLPTQQVRDSSLGALKSAIRQRNWVAVAKEAMALIGLAQVLEPIDVTHQIIFPEIGTEDRSAKLKDIATCQALEYFSHERAANMSASELGVTDYDYDKEQEGIRSEREERQTDPLYKGDEDPAKELLGKGALTPTAAGAPAAPGAEAPPAGSNADDAAYKQQNQQL